MLLGADHPQVLTEDKPTECSTLPVNGRRQMEFCLIWSCKRALFQVWSFHTENRGRVPWRKQV